METHVSLGRILGVKIGLHFSWILIAFLVVFSLSARFRMTNPDWGAGTIWLLAIATAALFFASIVAHELSHAMVAKARGLPVHSITLFALGGVARIEKESADAKTEFWMGIVGPISSALIGVLCLAAASALGWPFMAEPETPLLAMLVWLGYINVVLAVFNMLPGFPMDGGRVLRAAVWHATGDEHRATRVATTSGQAVAFGFIVLGIVGFFQGAGLGGLWLAFIGWFLLGAARASAAQLEVSESLRGVRVSDVMSRDCPIVDGRSNLETFVEDVLRTGSRCFLIVENGRVTGLITPHEVKSVEKSQWPYKTVFEVMKPLDQLRTVRPDTPASEALETIGRQDVNQLPVVSDGRLEGIVSRERIVRYLVTRAELNM
jgi:Zn-dependent protease